MNAKLGLLAAASVVFVLAGGAVQAASLTPIASYVDPAGGTTSVLSINSAGWMTGNISEPDGTSLGFVRNAAGVYSTFSVNTDTFGRSIDNNNNVIGYATDATQSMQTDNEFIRSAGGSVTILQNPNTLTPLRGIAQGDNASGAIVGDYYSGAGATAPVIGYILNGATFTSVQVPGSSRTSARAIEDDGTVAGWAVVGGVDEGFILDGGVFSYYQDPNAAAGNQGTLFEDINNNGLVSGMWVDASGDDHAFEFNSVLDVFTEINVPGADNVEAFGINDLGDVVLSAPDLTNGPNNFIYNAAGVPEPASWAMMLIGFVGLGSMLRRRHGALAV